ncbi:peptidoglycan-binding protein [Streptomyces sp. NPDC002588]|uniref:peptidoglycan-binding protein n=1 Tax=Streptomyces sp. NPDC002588 TaxID=3154419 RepID=UPI00332BA0CC
MPTPAEPEESQERRVVEPIRVLRPRNTDALAELFREMTELTGEPVGYEAISLPAGGGEAETEQLPPVGPDAVRDEERTAEHHGGPASAADWDWDRDRAGEPDGSGAGTSAGTGEHAAAGEPGGDEQDRFGTGTGRAGGGVGRPAGVRGQASPAFRPARGRRTHGASSEQGQGQGSRDWAGAAVPGRAERTRRSADGTRSGAGLRRAAVTVGVCAAALVGFAGALLLPGRGEEAAAQTSPPSPTPTATISPSAAGSADPDGAGTLREGDSGPEVTDLQKRLLRIPDVYKDGATDGRYTTVLTEAVARFQLWYGIRGDEDGVYGDDTRQALESRTG